MKSPLQLLHDREVELMAALPEDGYFEQRAPLIERLGLPGKWVEVLHDYVELFDAPPYRAEALRRAVFLVWYWWNEPWPLTAMRDRDPELEQRVLRALEAEMASDSPDRELQSMLGGYGESLPFDQHPEFSATLSVASGSPGLDSRVCLPGLETRGSMGVYWLSRNDLPDKPSPPTCSGPLGAE
jgi:hypothetical protein